MARTNAETAKYTAFLRLPLSSALRTMPGMNQAGGYDAMTMVKKNELKSIITMAMQDEIVRLLSSVKFGRVIMEPGGEAHACQGQIFHF